MYSRNGPLHYIAQPNLSVGSGKMQRNFISNKNKKSAAFDMNGEMIVENYLKETNRKDFYEDKENFSQKKEPITKSKEKKAFKDMDIEERILFLLERPFYIPASPCEIQTKEKSYFGYIERYDQGEIIMRHLNGQEQLHIQRKDIVKLLLLRM